MTNPTTQPFTQSNLFLEEGSNSRETTANSTLLVSQRHLEIAKKKKSDMYYHYGWGRMKDQAGQSVESRKLIPLALTSLFIVKKNLRNNKNNIVSHYLTMILA